MQVINEFIASELEYFKPMINNQSLVTNEMLKAFRDETLAQRKERISLQTYDLCDGVVRYGLFEGLKLNRETWWGKSDLGSQCLGFYEKEILNLIARRGPYEIFLDIGAADGYYAVGMLQSRMAKKVICFETSKEGQLAIQKNWITNNSVGELNVHGEANQLSIEKAAKDIHKKKSLVLVDIEGFEFSLLSKDVISLLKECELVIEIHNWVEDFEHKYIKLLSDLDFHFKITPLKRINKDIDIPLLRSFTDDNRLLVTSEHRPCLMRFLHLVPRS
jgi:hypothetical protein